MKHATVALVVVLASFAALQRPAAAEITGMTVHVKGLACPFCVFGLEKKLKALEGVRGVEVDLKTGIASLQVESRRPPSVNAVRKAVEQAGFTPHEVGLTAVGALRVEGRQVYLDVRDSAQQYVLFEPGKEPGFLDAATRRRLLDLAGSRAVVAVRGAVHVHAEGPPGLSVEAVERLAAGAGK